MSEEDKPKQHKKETCFENIDDEDLHIVDDLYENIATDLKDVIIW